MKQQRKIDIDAFGMHGIARNNHPALINAATRSDRSMAVNGNTR
jgi:hypothetical protein